MVTKVLQPRELGLGRAQVVVRPMPELDPAQLEVAIERDGSFLQDTGQPILAWGPSQTWVRPETASGQDGQLTVVLGERFTWNLRANVTYLLKLRSRTGETPVEVRLPWPAVRMPSTPPTTSPVDISSPPSPLVEIVETPAPDEPPVISAPPRPPKGRMGWGLWGALGVVVVLIVAVLWWWGRDFSMGTVSPNPTTIAWAKTFAQDKHSAEAYFQEAERFMKAGGSEAVQGAELLYSVAGDEGSIPGDLAMGRMLDPDLFVAEKSAFTGLDATEAAQWYQKAAAKDDPEALFRLGVLVQSGRASLPPNLTTPQSGIGLIQRSADLKYQPARDALVKLTETK